MFKKFIFTITKITKFIDKHGLKILVGNVFILSLTKCITSIFNLNEVK